jgi:hypothetical protein
MIPKAATAILTVTLLFAPLSIAQSQSAAAPPGVERPIPLVGDTWTFRRVDGWNGSTGTPVVETVVVVRDDEIEISRGEARDVRDRNWNVIGAVQDGTRSKARTYRGSLSFPLTIGKTWTAKAEFTNASGEQLSYAPKAEVVAWESVTVPAGTFDAFRIKASGFYRGSNATPNQFTGSFEETYGYSPAAQRVVRYQFQNSAKTKFTVELTEFRLVQR